MTDGECVFASWNGEPGVLGCYNGETTAKHPPAPLVRKMVAIAELLKGNVQGDDGERYPEQHPDVPSKRVRVWASADRRRIT